MDVFERYLGGLAAEATERPLRLLEVTQKQNYPTVHNYLAPEYRPKLGIIYRLDFTCTQ